MAIQLKQELALWTENQINISLLIDRLTNVTSTNEALRKDLLHLRSRLQVYNPKLFGNLDYILFVKLGFGERKEAIQ